MPLTGETSPPAATFAAGMPMLTAVHGTVHSPALPLLSLAGVDRLLPIVTDAWAVPAKRSPVTAMAAAIARCFLLPCFISMTLNPPAVDLLL